MPKRVLIIDDEEIIRTLSEKILARFGYDVIATASGEEGVAAFAEAKQNDDTIDVILLDLTLDGDFSGLETLARLKQLDNDVRVIVCSGYSSDPAIVDYSKHGFAGAIVKPFRAEDLAAEVDKVLKS